MPLYSDASTEFSATTTRKNVSGEKDSDTTSASASLSGHMGVTEVKNDVTTCAAAPTLPADEKVQPTTALVKKQKRKKKKKNSYSAMMDSVMAPPAMKRTTSAELREHQAKIAKQLGGGIFSKLEKI